MRLILSLSIDDWRIAGGRKLMLMRPRRQSSCSRSTATPTNSPTKYGVLMMPMFTNMRMLSTSEMARDIRLPVCCRSWKPKLMRWTWS